MKRYIYNKLCGFLKLKRKPGVWLVQVYIYIIPFSHIISHNPVRHMKVSHESINVYHMKVIKIYC